MDSFVDWIDTSLKQSYRLLVAIKSYWIGKFCSSHVISLWLIFLLLFLISLFRCFLVCLCLSLLFLSDDVIMTLRHPPLISLGFWLNIQWLWSSFISNHEAIGLPCL